MTKFSTGIFERTPLKAGGGAGIQGSFDSVNASLREAFTALRMTE
jgi:hypothetical protein